MLDIAHMPSRKTNGRRMIPHPYLFLLFIALLVGLPDSVTAQGQREGPSGNRPQQTKPQPGAMMLDSRTGLAFPETIGGLRRDRFMDANEPGRGDKGTLVTYTGSQLVVIVTVTDDKRPVPDGVEGTPAGSWFALSAIGVYDEMKRMNMRVEGRFDLPPKRCRIAEVEWLCGSIRFFPRGSSANDYDPGIRHMLVRGGRNSLIKVQAQFGLNSSSGVSEMEAVAQTMSRQLVGSQPRPGK